MVLATGARAVLGIVLGLVLAGPSTAAAAPFHGCTFLKDRLIATSWPGGQHTGCANFSVAPLTCTKQKTTPLGVVTYPGDLVTGRLPAYFIEVTPFKGFSVFAEDTVDGLTLRPHIKASEAWWSFVMEQRYPGLGGVVGLLPGSGDGRVDPTPGSNGGFLYARTIKVPYGALAWTFASIGVTQGSAAPMCFDGISEFTPETWADLPGHPETGAALLVAPLTELLCDREFSGIYGPELPIDSPFDNVRQTCAIPALPQWVLANIAEPTSEVWEIGLNPRKACAGRLGAHLPRTGWTGNAPNEWEAANLVAYRMATLAEDHFITGPGIEPGDRWQLVWPPMASPGAHKCGRPGAVRPLETLTDGPIAWPQLPGTDGPVRPGGTLGAYARGGGSYVWAVWRKFSRCVEPGMGALFSAELTAHHTAAVAACSAVGATDGMP